MLFNQLNRITLNRPSLVFLIFILISIRTLGQNCNCDKVIPITHGHLIDGNTLGIKPGDVVCLMAGTRTSYLIRNVRGTSQQPVVIKNCGGKLTINASTSYGIQTERSSHLRITGTGDPSIEQGIEVIGTHFGIHLTTLSSDIELDHTKVHDVGFAGIVAKTDPNCSDTLTWRKNYIMRNIKIHHNEVYNTATGEGIYIGYSSYGTGIKCDTTFAFPHSIINASIHHNNIYNTGAEGLQVGCVIEGCEIFNNIISEYGQRPFNNHPSQQNGIQLGEGTGGLCYNNYISAGSVVKGSSGIILLGLGDNLLFNNVIVRPGENGIFMDERPPATQTGAGTYFKFINNTVIEPGQDGIKTYAELIEYNEIVNNIIINPGTGRYINNKGGPGVPVIRQSNNYTSDDINTAGFQNHAVGNFKLTQSSPAKNRGANATMWGIHFDIENTARPAGSGYDIGAYEFSPDTPNQLPSIAMADELRISLPVDSVNISATASDPDGEIDSYLWEKISGPHVTMERTKTNSLKISGITEGTYKFRLTVTDNANASSQKDIDVIATNAKQNVPPVVDAGKDVVIHFPVNSISLQATANDNDGFITEYLWTKVSGGNATLNNATTSNVSISNLEPGNYVFRVTVTDNDGAKESDEVTVLVNRPPVANAGPDVTIRLPQNSVTIKGSATDPDGTVVSYQWTKISGGGVKMSGTNTPTLSLSGLKQGNYVFRLTTRDNHNAVGIDDILVTVNKK
ncbi:MAG: PKD domain-containing protein [Cytophagaceae bacterium]